jgi:hypothetical protein
MKNIICILILFLSWLQGSSQIKYFGIVLDNETKKPISNISVTAIIKHDTIKTKTDIYGQYSFQGNPCKRLHLNFRSRDYRPFDIENNFANPKLKGSCQLKKVNMIQMYMNMSFDRAFALGNITNNNVFILLPGGIVGTEVLDSDTIFEYKYKIKYVSQGCIKFGDETEYNKTIFEFLDKTYGSAWRKEIREDAIGLK